ncbi:5-deoxy-glucuronate isomerase [Agromyces endophyticus]|uniref:5-deoxy-glucuronate isomerase n=1 Tax=Agromyces sp. H17E-10 TaxID=2932244 RepID=UPI001FD51517|nr:5-deoxy-glucuronate isomerase [Agromyces sp. H17E-10]UOQ90915.1 5-deoxy-glucuronate isomerase [Agromyces sp. H17E-10]
MSNDARWFHPHGSLARDGWSVVVDGTIPGWRHTGLRVAELGGRSGDTDGGSAARGLELPAGEVERQLVPLAGGGVHVDVVDADGSVHAFELDGRASVFDGPTDTLYLPVGASAVVHGTGRLAVAEAPATTRHPLRLIGRDEAPVELRGRGQASRQVHDLGTPAVMAAERLIVCEVITPAGNWSSYPPHKHDEEVPGVESQLEEIYYFEAAPTVRPSPTGDASGTASHGAAQPFALFSASSSSVTDITIDERVTTGDVALLPGGYHGPAAAAPGYDLYYLNVMAGPGERVWRITDEPAHAWVRDTWNDEAVDPRLPYPAAPATNQSASNEGTPQ